MSYFVGHAVFLMFSTDFQSPQDNIIHVDIVYFTLDFRPNHLVVILMAVQTLFNYRIFYFRLDRGLFRLLHLLLYHAETFFIENERQLVENFRRFTIRIVLLIRAFYVILDLYLIYYQLFFTYHLYHLSCQQHSISPFKLLIFLLNITKWNLFLTLFAYSNAIIGVSVLTALKAILIRFQQNERLAVAIAQFDPLQSSNRSVFAQFTRNDIQNFEILFTLNRTFGRLFLNYFLVNVPISAYVLVILLFGPTDLVVKLFLAAFVTQQIVVIFMTHFAFAMLSNRAHRASGHLLSLMANQQDHRIGFFRCRFTLFFQTIVRLHTTKKYGISYGAIMLITMTSFTRFLLYYGKLLIMSYKVFSVSRKVQ
ncbi:hypothetical protein TYRP_018676 [Tyrophagus putrescentiae]|nr:hypothetical protein TYRP_018676 [Tyrophagus putrescentiae]